jgi:retinol dehydrogenase 12
VLFTVELARRLTGTGVTANCLAPGFVRTNLGRDATGVFRLLLGLTRPFQSSPETGAATAIYLATSTAVAQTSGGYFERCRPARPSALAGDQAAAERLWRLSARLGGLDADLPAAG